MNNVGSIPTGASLFSITGVIEKRRVNLFSNKMIEFKYILIICAVAAFIFAVIFLIRKERWKKSGIEVFHTFSFDISEKEIETLDLTFQSIIENAVPGKSKKITGLWWSNKTLESPRHTNSPNNGLCFSGGGAVAMIYTAGYLRGLRAANILDDTKIRHIAASSGGTWTLIPCAYVSSFEEESDIDQHLGKYKDPSRIMMYEMINLQPEPFIGNSARGGTLFKLIFEYITNYSKSANSEEIPPEQVLTEAMSKIVLKPAKMYYPVSVVQREREEALEALDKIITEIKEKSAFYLRPHFPFPHCITTALDSPGPSFDMTEPVARYPLEMTPSRMGCLSENMQYKNIPLGGQIVNYCFGGKDTQGSIPIANNSAVVETVIQNKYNLVGLNKYISYPSDLFSAYQLKDSTLKKFVPNPYLNLPNTNNELINDFFIGDGGYYDDSGACTLMARQVKHIYIFMFDGCLKPNKTTPSEGVYPMSLQQLFGYEVGKFSVWSRGLLQDDNNHTLFWEVVDKLNSLYDSEQPAIYTQIYNTNDVPEAGIVPYEVKITWIIPSKTLSYESLLQPDIRSKLKQIKNYPQFIVPPFTFTTIQLSNFEINAGMNLAAWVGKNYIAPMILDDLKM